MLLAGGRHVESDDGIVRSRDTVDESARGERFSGQAINTHKWWWSPVVTEKGHGLCTWAFKTPTYHRTVAPLDYTM